MEPYLKKIVQFVCTIKKKVNIAAFLGRLHPKLKKTLSLKVYLSALIWLCPNINPYFRKRRFITKLDSKHVYIWQYNRQNRQPWISDQ